MILIKLSTEKTVSEAAAALQIAVQANHYGVMQAHDLKEIMTKKGVKFDHECRIFEVCQPQQAKTMLDQNMSLSTALPCRISIYREDAKTFLAALKPTYQQLRKPNHEHDHHQRRYTNLLQGLGHR